MTGVVPALLTVAAIITFDKVMQKVSKRKIRQIYAKYENPDGSIPFGDFKKAWEESRKWTWLS